jgi:hypothetical protein
MVKNSANIIEFTLAVKNLTMKDDLYTLSA